MSEYSDNALKIYERLYFNHDEKEPHDVHVRVAGAVSSTKKLRDKYVEMMDGNIFRPNTPTMVNANKKKPGQLCACFVLGLRDELSSIIDMWKICSDIFSTGGGAGIPITNLREEGGATAFGEASGPLKYMSVLQSVGDTIWSGGRNRKAAILSSFRYNHPDIINLVKSKIGGGFSSFNTSVLVDDDFMNIICDSPGKDVSLVSPNYRSDGPVGSVSADELWDTLIDCAWKCGDPGLLFFNTANKYNTTPSLGEIVCSNPCGEVLMPPWSVCTLGHINVGEVFSEAGKDLNKFFSLLSCYSKYGTYFLDDVIRSTTFPHQNFKKATLKSRPIGLGIMGLSDLFYLCGLKYGSDESIALFEKICFYLTSSAIETSIDMVGDGRKPLKLTKYDMSSMFNVIDGYLTFDGFDDKERILKKFEKNGICNSQWTTIAPTGSTSISADCSYGFEPCFAVVWEKKLTDSKARLKFIDKTFSKMLPSLSMSSGVDKETIINDIVNNSGSLLNINYIPDNVKDIFVVTHDIDPLVKIKMQAAGQKYISLSISSTCNLPGSASRGDVASIYKEAWKRGLKGITVYRDGCKYDQPVSFKGGKSFRPTVRSGKTVEINTPDGDLFVTCNVDNFGKPMEVFFSIGKHGSLVNQLTDALAITISKGLQNGVKIGTFVDSLIGARGDMFWFKISEESDRSVRADSILDCIAKVIMYLFGESVGLVEDQNRCQSCGAVGSVVTVTGCRGELCTLCGFGSCG